MTLPGAKELQPLPVETGDLTEERFYPFSGWSFQVRGEPGMKLRVFRKLEAPIRDEYELQVVSTDGGKRVLGKLQPEGKKTAGWHDEAWEKVTFTPAPDIELVVDGEPQKESTFRYAEHFPIFFIRTGKKIEVTTPLEPIERLWRKEAPAHPVTE